MPGIEQASLAQNPSEPLELSENEKRIETSQNGSLADGFAHHPLVDNNQNNDTIKKSVVKKTFAVGVRFFAPSEQTVTPLSDEDETSPFEPARLRFHCLKPVFKRCEQDDTGDRPLYLFGDILDKVCDLNLGPETKDIQDAIDVQKRESRAYFKRNAAKLSSLDDVISRVAAANPRLPTKTGRPSTKMGPSNEVGSLKTSRLPSHDVEDRLTAKKAFMPKRKMNATVASIATKSRKPFHNEPVDELAVFHEKRPSAEEQLKIDYSSVIGDRLTKGTRVLAKWTDKNCYPGIVLQNDTSSKCKVRFIDGETRQMPLSEVLPLWKLKSGDYLMVYACVANDYEFHPSVIRKCPDKKDAVRWQEGLFEIENRAKATIETISWERLAIEASQIKNYSLLKRGSESADSFVEKSVGRRSLRPKRPKYAFDASPRDLYDFQSDEDEPSSDPPYRAGSNVGKPPTLNPVFTARRPGGEGIRYALTAHPTGVYGHYDPTEHKDARITKRRPDAQAKTFDGSSSLSEAEPPSLTAEKPVTSLKQPTFNKIFKGMKFVLTSAMRNKETPLTKNADSSFVPFTKRHVRQLIEERGGEALEDFPAIGGTKDTFLIADQFYRTHKYLSALVRAVPCVSHMWIYECCKEDRLLLPTTFMLPAGVALETDTVVDWHHKCPTLLSGLSVFMYTESKLENPGTLNFVQIWSPIVKLMGANVIEALLETGGFETQIDILLTDSTCPRHVIERCRPRIPPVSSEWLIQGVITGQLPQPNGHPKYSYDYSEVQLAGPNPRSLIVGPPQPLKHLPLDEHRTIDSHAIHSTLHVGGSNYAADSQKERPVLAAGFLAHPSSQVQQSVVTSSSNQQTPNLSVTTDQQQTILVASSSNDGAIIDPSSIPEGAIDISNMTAEQLQALGISFVDADEYATLIASQQQQQQSQQQVADVVDQTTVDFQQPHQTSSGQTIGFEGQQQFELVVSPEHLALISEEGAQVLVEEGMLVVHRADGSRTVLGAINDADQQSIQTTDHADVPREQ